MMDTINFIEEYSQTLQFLTILIGGIFALYQYRSNSRIRRSEVLIKLYEKFYEQPNLKKIRDWIDYEDNNKKTFEKEIENPKFEYEVNDYLNFFEFMAALVKIKQIREEEILLMFSYYLKKLNEKDYLKEYILEYHYKNLTEFLKTKNLKQ